METATILMRYRMEKGMTGELVLSGIRDFAVYLKGSGDFDTTLIPLRDLQAGDYSFQLTSASPSTLEIDGFVLFPSPEREQIKFVKKTYHPIPKVEKQENGSILLKYEDIGSYYGIAWLFDPSEIREFHTDELDRFMRHTIHNHVSSVLKGNGDGHFTDVFLRPIDLKPQSGRIIYGMVCTGDKNGVSEKLTRFADNARGANRGNGIGESNAIESFEAIESYEGIYKEKREKVADLFRHTPEGKRYLFSQKRMAATVLTNVVYPVYIKRGYIKHYTPGRWWDCLYTWDSGFIGLGLSTLDLERAIDCLNAYVTDPGDDQSAFIHHGSPVPVQFYLFLELWNRTQLKDLLRFFYPRLKQYYEFYSGKLGSSTTGRLKSNLLTTWDYFYNSGGWDDYPPQGYVHREKLEKSVAPVITTSQCIRIAKIMRMAASALGYTEDMAEYGKDIELFTAAIQNDCWDAESGYFSYVRHDDAGYPTGILKDKNGVNYNMGLDGVYPLVAGICNMEQKQKILYSLTSEQHLWTNIGISTVDQSAPYYRIDGYWNGAVWMPHQWFFWKTMLDIGADDFAAKIVMTGLDLWEREVSCSYRCFEHFILESGRGAGWHEFGGLSSPVLCWFEAYFKPGTVTCGFDVWIEEKEFSPSNTALLAKLRYFGKEESISIIAVVLQITLNNTGSHGVISIDVI